MINEEVRHIIEPELGEGEKLLWTDKAVRGFELRKIIIKAYNFFAKWFLLFFIFISSIAVVYGYLSFFDIVRVEPKEEKEVVDGLIIGGPVLLISGIFGFFLFKWAGEFAVEITEAVEHEVYAITSRRGLIISPYFKHRIRTISESDLKKHKVTGKDIGRLSFPPDRKSLPSFYGSLFNFYNIQNPKYVSELIRQNF